MSTRTVSEDEGISSQFEDELEEPETFVRKFRRFAKEMGSKPVRLLRVVSQKAAKKPSNQEAESSVNVDVPDIVNDRLQRQAEAPSKDADEKAALPAGRGSEMEKLELPRRKNYERKGLLENFIEGLQLLEKLNANLQRITSCSEGQKKEIEKLMRRNKCLEDEIIAARQISVETQIRQLSELQSLTDETIELKQTLTELQQQQQQQQSARDEHHQGNYYIKVITTSSLYAGGYGL